MLRRISRIFPLLIFLCCFGIVNGQNADERVEGKYVYDKDHNIYFIFKATDARHGTWTNSGPLRGKYNVQEGWIHLLTTPSSANEKQEQVGIGRVLKGKITFTHYFNVPMEPTGKLFIKQSSR